jgi:hypothetical protein
MAHPDPLDDRRTAIALVRAQVEGDHAAWLELVQGTDDLVGVLAAVSSYAARVTEIIGHLTETAPNEALSQFALELGREDGRRCDATPPPS